MIHVRALGFTIGSGTTVPFVVCTSGIFLCYCLSSISQEYLYSIVADDGVKFHFTSTVALV
jgi:hypothetical protein